MKSSDTGTELERMKPQFRNDSDSTPVTAVYSQHPIPSESLSLSYWFRFRTVMK